MHLGTLGTRTQGTRSLFFRHQLVRTAQGKWSRGELTEGALSFLQPLPSQRSVPHPACADRYSRGGASMHEGPSSAEDTIFKGAKEKELSCCENNGFSWDSSEFPFLLYSFMHCPSVTTSAA